MAIDSLPMLGPHEGRELELLLSGEKPIAFFYEGLPDEFLPYLESGILKSRTKTTTTRLPNIQIENILIYKDVAIEQVDELISVSELSKNKKKKQLFLQIDQLL